MKTYTTDSQIDLSDSNKKSVNLWQFYLFLVLFLIFFSCNKKKEDITPEKGPCSDFQAPYATNNGPVSVGGTLQLNASSNEQNITYEWTGPKNFSSQLQNPVINSIAFDAGGTYYVRINNDICSSNTNSTQVIVNSPCSIQDNTGIFGSATWNFYNAVTCGSSSGGNYLISGSSTVGGLQIKFANNDAPALNKIYSVDNGNPGFDSSHVQLTLSPPGDVLKGQAGNVYVSIYGGIISAAFCGVQFKSSLTAANYSGSAKLNCQ